MFGMPHNPSTYSISHSSDQRNTHPGHRPVTICQEERHAHTLVSPQSANPVLAFSVPNSIQLQNPGYYQRRSGQVVGHTASFPSGSTLYRPISGMTTAFHPGVPLLSSPRMSPGAYLFNANNKRPRIAPTPSRRLFTPLLPRTLMNSLPKSVMGVPSTHGLTLRQPIRSIAQFPYPVGTSGSPIYLKRPNSSSSSWPVSSGPSLSDSPGANSLRHIPLTAQQAIEDLRLKAFERAVSMEQTAGTPCSSSSSSMSTVFKHEPRKRKPPASGSICAPEDRSHVCLKAPAVTDYQSTPVDLRSSSTRLRHHPLSEDSTVPATTRADTALPFSSPMIKEVRSLTTRGHDQIAPSSSLSALSCSVSSPHWSSPMSSSCYSATTSWSTDNLGPKVSANTPRAILEAGLASQARQPGHTFGVTSTATSGANSEINKDIQCPLKRIEPQGLRNVTASILSRTQIAPLKVTSSSANSRTLINLYTTTFPRSLSSAYAMSPHEEVLWRRAFFGRENPQQLIYTLVYLMVRVLGLRTGAQLRQLRHGKNSQLKFILSACQAAKVPKSDIRAAAGAASSTDEDSGNDDGTTVCDEIGQVDSRLQLEASVRPFFDLSTARLLYVPDNKDTNNDSKEDDTNEIQKGIGDHSSDRSRPEEVASSTLKKTSSLLEEHNEVRNLTVSSSQGGYILEHFPNNNHQRCLVCMHAFHLSMRPRRLRPVGTRASESYFLAWQPEPTPTSWFRPRPITLTCLSSILKTIEAALICAAAMLPSPTLRAPADLSESRPVTRATAAAMAPMPMKSLGTGVEPRDDGGGPQANRSPAASVDYPMIMATSPLNLVVRECGSDISVAVSTTATATITPSHPTCLGYWPQFTQRARQSTWQCTDCKSCNVCQQKKSTSDLLICDACDGGFHSDCLPLQATSTADSSQLWVCTDCQKAGYSVATSLQQAPEGGDNPSSSSSSSSNPVVVTMKQDERVDEQPAVESVLDKVEDAGGEVNGGEGCADSEALGPEAEEEEEKEEKMGATAAATAASPSAVHSPPSSCASGDLGVGTGDRLVSVDRSTAVKEEVHGSQQKKSVAVNVGAGDTNLPTNTTTNSRASVGGDARSASLLRPSDGMRFNYQSPTPSSSVSGVPETQSTSKWDGCAGLEASRPLDIRAWSMEEVHDWLLVEGFPREAEAFQQQEIDGACLLLMKRMDVLTELGIKLGPAVKIYERIKRLQAGCTSPSVSFLTAT